MIVQGVGRVRSYQHDHAYADMCARIYGIMLKPTRHVTTGARSVNTAPVPMFDECACDDGVYLSPPGASGAAPPPTATLAPAPALEQPPQQQQSRYRSGMAGGGSAGGVGRGGGGGASSRSAGAGGGGSAGSATNQTTSIQERLSGKRGLVRDKVQTCRRDLCARAVMSCDNYKSVTDLVISPSLARGLLQKEPVNPLNRARIMESMLQGRVVSVRPARHMVGTTTREVFLPYVRRLAYRPKVGDKIIDPVHQRTHTVTTPNALPVPQLKTYYRIKREGQTLEAMVPAALPVVRVGDTIERHMEDGDIGLRLRNPCLYEASILAQTYREVIASPAVPVDQDPCDETEHTSRRNTSEALAQKGDFDGDDCTTIVCRNFPAQAECRRLMSPQALFLTSKNNSAVMYPTQDSALGMWALTFFSPSCAPLFLPTAFVDDLLVTANVDQVTARMEYAQGVWSAYARAHPQDVSVCVVEHLASLVVGRPFPFAYTGFGVVSMLLPRDLCFEEEPLISHGVFLAGHLSANVWATQLLPFVYRACGPDEAVAFLDRVELAGATIAERLGLSISAALPRQHAVQASVLRVVKAKIDAARAVAEQQCATHEACAARDYRLHHTLLGVQNAAQQEVDRLVVQPLLGEEVTPNFRTVVEWALESALAGVQWCVDEWSARAVGGPCDKAEEVHACLRAAHEEMAGRLVPALGTRFSLDTLRQLVPVVDAMAMGCVSTQLARILGMKSLEPCIRHVVRSHIVVALVSPRATVRVDQETADFAPPEPLRTKHGMRGVVFAPPPAAARAVMQARADLPFLDARVDPMAVYCAGSRSLTLGTLTQMMGVIGQLFDDRGMPHDGAPRTSVPVQYAGRSCDPSQYVRDLVPNEARGRNNVRAIPNTHIWEQTCIRNGMVLESFTSGLRASSMNIMSNYARTTMANGGNGTRRAGHQARLLSLHGENISCGWDGAWAMDNGRVVQEVFGASGMWSSRKTFTKEDGEMPVEPDLFAAVVNARALRLAAGGRRPCTA